MSVDAQTREQTVDAAIREISHIATLPEITLRIIELVEDPNSTAQDLHKLISNDPALSSRILKVVNSAFYGLPGQVGSINRAIVLLGLNAVKNIAIAASLGKLFRGGSLTPDFSARALWDHCIATAVASRSLANTLNIGMADEAFLAGLMHDIGIVVEIQFDRHALIEVLGQLTVDDEGNPTADMLELELAAFGATHQDFGRGLCERWKFPENFAQVSGFHHNPQDLPEERRTLTTVVAVADHLAARLPDRFRLDVPSTTVPEAYLDILKITQAQVDEVADKFEEELEEVARMMEAA